LSVGNCICLFKKTVCQGTFTVVDMGYYTEIADVMHYMN
jgi:hypothetical protein